ncbi:MAG TPA: hypothetical protein IGR64_07140 [Leptolyngbyaceae cyanobacterium M65_K2018_010]|nr:hypothetical protein [Leptolyngbyaceae cyanobacterium M65_K2018_010]
MFLDELSPLVRELMGHPAAFLGGVASGLLRLSLGDDPVKSWLTNQGVTPPGRGTGYSANQQNGGGPQTIAID